MFITLVVPTITQYTRLHRMLTTISEGTRRPDRIIVIDNGNIGDKKDITYASLWPQLQDFNGLYDEWFIQSKNLGVAGSCNQALRFASIQEGGYWLHANDDIEVTKDVVASLERGAKLHSAAMAVIPAANAGSAFTFFLMPAQRAIDEIGWWDEEFYPAYYEDNDYAYRMGLKGYKWVPVQGGSYIHHISSTKKAYTGAEEEWGHERFRANRARYIKKWCPDVDDKGDPIFGTERYVRAFNGEPQE